MPFNLILIEPVPVDLAGDLDVAFNPQTLTGITNYQYFSRKLHLMWWITDIEDILPFCWDATTEQKILYEPRVTLCHFWLFRRLNGKI